MRNSFGVWTVVDRNGQHPLRDPDPVRRLRAAHLMAAAPVLRSVAQENLERFERWLSAHGMDYRDQYRLQICRLSLSFAEPELELLLAAEGERQIELPFHDQEEAA